MLLLEIAAQGVKGVAPAGGRLTFRPGYNVVAVDGPVLRRLVEALLYPGPRDGDAIPRSVAGPGGGPVRAGLSLTGNDKVTYRLVRDFAAGIQLHRFDPQQRSFALVSQDPAAIATHLQQTAGIPSRRRLAALLALAAAELPSKAAPAGLGGAAPAAPAARRPVSPAELQRKLGELRGELERARKAEKLQYRLDGLQGRLFKLEEALREGARIREGAEGARASLGGLAAVEAVAARLGDPEARLAAFARAAGKRDEALARAAEERAAIDEVEGRGDGAPPWLDPGVLGGAAGGLLAFAAGAWGMAHGSGVRYVALLDIPAFGFAAWTALRRIEGLEERSRVGRRRKVVEERERKAAEQFERDAGEVRQALKELGAAGLPELREQLGKLAGARAAAAEWQAKLEAWEGQPETRGAREERARVEAELREVEGELSAEAGGYVRDPRSVEAEIARLEQEAAAPPEPAAVEAPAAPAAPAVEPLRGLLERAAAEIGQSPTALARGLQAKASQHLAALTGQRLAGLSVDDRGNLTALSGGRPQPALGLPPGDRDACFLALRLALMEQALAGAQAVALCDDAFAGLPEAGRRMAARLLKAAARPGQLLHATRDPLFREAADHAV